MSFAQWVDPACVVIELIADEPLLVRARLASRRQEAACSRSSSAASPRESRCIGIFQFGNVCRVTPGKFAMNAASFFASRVPRPEKRYLVSLIKIIDPELLVRKREHGWSLCRTDAYEKARPMKPCTTQCLSNLMSDLDRKHILRH